MNLIKTRIIKGLIDEIMCLDPSNLELVGHKIISILECKRMIHHGINKDNKPCGYTVDSFTDDSMIVAEYSTGKDYFTDSTPNASPTYRKIDKDVNHAINHNISKKPNRIYLISSMEEPPSFRAKFNETPIAKLFGESIIIYDAREIARLIYEQSIANPSHAAFYRGFFPGFLQDFDNYEYYGKVPAQCQGYISDQGIFCAIRNHFEKGHDICILHGLSGSGKTQAAIDYIHREGKNFENYIWITGDDWKSNTSLSAIQRTRGGSSINVAGIFNSSRTLLVVDGIERCLDRAQLSELIEGFNNKGSVVLATSQTAVPGNQLYLPIPTLSKEVAYRILNEDPARTSEKCNETVESCRFSPLILSTIRNIAELQGVKRDDLYTEVVNAPAVIAGPDSLSIMSRILTKLNQETLEALKKIANSGSTTHDWGFLGHFIGIITRSNLRQLSILMPTNTPGIVRVHDLICKSVQENLNSYVVANAISEYIEKNKGEMTPSVLRQIHLCHRQIKEKNTKRGQRNPDWLTYALLQVEGGVKCHIYDQIFSKEITSDLALSSVMCIVDAKEMHAYKIKNPDERKRYYKLCELEYQKAFNKSSKDDIKAELLHHRGKALRRLADYKNSYCCFSQLLELKPKWHAAHGQIAHLGVLCGEDKHIKEEGEKSIRILLENMLQEAPSVPLRVSLAAFARLRSYHKVRNEISSRSEDVEKLAGIISSSALEGFGQFYEAFVSFTSLFGYHHSLCCTNLAETLQEILLVPPGEVDRKQWVSACESLSNTSIAAKSAGKINLSRLSAKAGVGFAESLLSENQLAPYAVRAVAKAFLTDNSPKKALEVIARIESENIDHWLLYRKAEAQLAIDDNNGALKSANVALKLAENDPKAKDRISIYHDLLSKCYEQLKENTNALSELGIAIKKCTDSRYKQELKERIEHLKTLIK